MNRFVRSTLALALAFLFALPMTALCEGVTLALSEEGTLTIGGSGTVPSDILALLSEDELACVTDVVIEEGITGLDGYALERVSDQLVSVTFPTSVTTLGPNVLGTKGALDYTIFGDAETLRPLLSSSNEDYGYLCTFKAAAPAMPDVPASAIAQSIAQEMAGRGAEMTLSAAEELSDNHGNIRYQYTYAAPEDCTVRLTSFDGGQIGQIIITVETLTPGATWTALCRGIPQTAALGLPDGIRETLAGIELNNGGKNQSASADGWDIQVGGVMDVRSAWNLNKQGATDHYTYD